MKRRGALEQVLSVVRVLPFAERAARSAANTLIAGTALANSATLITHNTLEFSRVPGLQLLDWY